jgi:hypothetical protein
VLATIMQAAGVGTVLTATALISPLAALIVLGLVILAIGIGLEKSSGTDD